MAGCSITEKVEEVDKKLLLRIKSKGATGAPFF
jgi:hypothetical protein